MSSPRPGAPDVRRPTFIAEQARNAHGVLGRVIAFIMARETWAQNQRAIEALEVAPEDNVLDIGCGPGRALSALAAKAVRGRVVGADPSELMIEIASDRNKALLRSGRVDVAVAGVEALPFPRTSFDKVLCVHVLYFWSDLVAALREIRRVLKPGGQFVLLFRTTADERATSAFPPEVYRFRPLAEVIADLKAAGLDLIEADGEGLVLVRGRRPA